MKANPVLIKGFLFVAAALGFSILALPKVARWRTFAFEDAGASLATLVLTASGDRPGVDNGYLYGLLPMAATQGWYGLFGATPGAALSAWVLANVLVACGLARFAVHARVGWPGVAVMLAATPLVGVQSLAHAIEPVLLVNALAEQARGRRSAALALVTLCAFDKPSMAYVYGLILVVTILGGFFARGPKPSWLDRARALIPAIVVGVVCVLLLAGLYGPGTLANSLFPSRAAAVYKEGGFGFFHGVGRNFWRPPGAGFRYYLGTPAGFWLAGSLVLILGASHHTPSPRPSPRQRGEGVIRSPRPFGERVRVRGFRPGPVLLDALGAVEGFVHPSKDDADGQNREVVATCAALHLAFVCCFFGNAWSYNYYLYILTMGLAALSPRTRRHSSLVLILAACALLGQKASIADNLSSWRSLERRPETLGLWVLPDEGAEWSHVLSLVRGGRPSLLATSDGASCLFPDFAPAVLWYASPGNLTRVEIRRKRAQLSSSPFVIETPSIYDRWPSDQFPTFREALSGSELVFPGTYYRVYRRK